MSLLQGTLPHDYLDITEHKLAELMFCNARQMVAQYNKKRELTEAGALSFIYREFSMLSKSKETKIVDEIRLNIAAERYRESVSTSCALLGFILVLFFETVNWTLMYDIEDLYVFQHVQNRSKNSASITHSQVLPFRYL